jgi:hypothetical protein
MPALRFPQYLKDHGLYLLLFSNKKYVPGSILRRKGDAFHHHDNLSLRLKDPKLSWETELVDANIPQVIEGSRQVGAGGKLILPFLKINGGLNANRFVDFRISAVDQRIFTDNKLFLWNHLLGRLQWLRHAKPDIWKRIKGRYLVLSTWFAREYEVSLGRALTGNLNANFQKKISPTAGAQMNIDSTNKILNVSGNLRIPFAFHGERLVRI